MWGDHQKYAFGFVAAKNELDSNTRSAGENDSGQPVLHVFCAVIVGVWHLH